MIEARHHILMGDHEEPRIWSWLLSLKGRRVTGAIGRVPDGEGRTMTATIFPHLEAMATTACTPGNKVTQEEHQLNRIEQSWARNFDW